jgi:phosphoenolpyruvate carboxykinase (ATP)
MPITAEQMTIASFPHFFQKIVADKAAAGVKALEVNPADLLQRAQTYGTQYANGSWGWSSNIWSRSAAQSDVVDSEADLKPAHRILMRNVLERVLCTPMIQADATMGMPGSRVEMRCRLICDPQFPDLPYRWQQLNFPGDPAAEPDAWLFCVPHYLNNPNMPGGREMLRVMRFPNANYTLVTVSSYQGEIKKGFLSHWIKHVYERGGTGEHAALKEFTVRRPDRSLRRVIMGCWGLTGSGKSTHGLYVVTDRIVARFKKMFGVDLSKLVFDQALKNDDITAWFEDGVFSPEKGAWTKTEDVDENQEGIYAAATMPHALHENTEWDEHGEVCFEGKLFQYQGVMNRNARSVLQIADMGCFDGSVDSTAPPNMAVFISPGYVADFAWLKLNDPYFAAKVLADGRTVGHPAQSLEGVGEEKYESRYCLPFTMGILSAAHVHRFLGFLANRQGADDPIEVYQINTTGRIGGSYTWGKVVRDGNTVEVPRAVFEEVNGKRTAVGGTGPSIEETELFLLQAARGAVEYEPHPIWGDRVLYPVKVPGLPARRLKELNPFTTRSMDEMKRLLRAQIQTGRYYLDKQCAGLDPAVREAMDF